MVKRRTCARDQFLLAARQIPAQTFWGKCCHVKYAKESWKKSGIGNKSIENGSSGLFVYKAYLITGFLQIYHYDFVFELYQGSYTVFKHRELLVCMVVDNSLKTSWLLQPEAKFAHAGKRLTVEGPLHDSSKCCTIGGHAKKLGIYPA